MLRFVARFSVLFAATLSSITLSSGTLFATTVDWRSHACPLSALGVPEPAVGELIEALSSRAGLVSGGLDGAADREWFARLHDRQPYALELLTAGAPALARRAEGFLFADLGTVAPLSRYSAPLRALILGELGALQLENRCLVGCPWCGSSNNVRGEPYYQFPVPALRSLFREMRAAMAAGRVPKKAPMLYFESDPFDYEMPIFAGADAMYLYPDLHALFIAYTGLAPFTSTALPKRREAVVMDFVARRLRGGLRLSLSEMNRSRAEAPWEGGPLTYVEELKSRYLRDVWRNWQATSRWSDDELVAKYRELQPRYPKLKPAIAHDRRPASPVEREDLVVRVSDLILQSWDREVVIQPIRPVQVGLGFNNARYERSEVGIGCFWGTVITPKLIGNLVQINPPSPKYPDGEILVELPPTFERRPLPRAGVLEDVLRSGIVRQQWIFDLPELNKYRRFALFHPLTAEELTYEITTGADGAGYAAVADDAEATRAVHELQRSSRLSLPLAQ